MTASPSERARTGVRIEPCAKWVRAFLDGTTVVDSTHVRMVWEKPAYPTYYFPASDVRRELLHATGEIRESPERGAAQLYDLRVGDRVAEAVAYRHADSPIEELRDLFAFQWRALDHWFEEDEEVFVHARSPYARIDVLPSSRSARVEIGGVVVAESTHPTLLFETRLPARYYFPEPDVRLDLLVPTDHETACPYKGTARYWSVVTGGDVHGDVAWCYEDPLPESVRIAGLISFFNERVDLYVNGELQPRPHTVFS